MSIPKKLILCKLCGEPLTRVTNEHQKHHILCIEKYYKEIRRLNAKKYYYRKKKELSTGKEKEKYDRKERELN